MVGQSHVSCLKWLTALQKYSADITCRMTYRRIEEIASLRSNEPSLALPELVHTSGQRHESYRQDIFTEDKIEDFTRVRIWTRTAGPVLGASIRGFILSTLNPIRQKRHTLINNSFRHQSGISILQSSTKDNLDK